MKVEDGNPNLLQFYPETSKLSIEESVLGLQAILKLSDRTKAVVQAQLEGRNDFEFNTEWAYIQHSFTRNYDIAFGKMSMPLFYRSRYRNVNYGLDDSIDSSNSTRYVSSSYRVSNYLTLTYHYERYNQNLDNFKQLSNVTDSILRTSGEQDIRNFAQREFYLNCFDWRYDFDTRTALKAGYW